MLLVTLTVSCGLVPAQAQSNPSPTGGSRCSSCQLCLHTCSHQRSFQFYWWELGRERSYLPENLIELVGLGVALASGF